jgi:hypothetical protein
MHLSRIRLVAQHMGRAQLPSFLKVKSLDRAVFVGNPCRESHQPQLTDNGKELRLQSTGHVKLPFLGMECAHTTHLRGTPLRMKPPQLVFAVEPSTKNNNWLRGKYKDTLAGAIKSNGVPFLQVIRT